MYVVKPRAIGPVIHHSLSIKQDWEGSQVQVFENDQDCWVVRISLEGSNSIAGDGGGAAAESSSTSALTEKKGSNNKPRAPGQGAPLPASQLSAPSAASMKPLQPASSQPLVLDETSVPSESPQGPASTTSAVTDGTTENATNGAVVSSSNVAPSSPSPGLLAYMNVFMRCNPLITSYQLTKVCACVCVFMLKHFRN